MIWLDTFGGFQIQNSTFKITDYAGIQSAGGGQGFKDSRFQIAAVGGIMGYKQLVIVISLTGFSLMQYDILPYPLSYRLLQP